MEIIVTTYKNLADPVILSLFPRIIPYISIFAFIIYFITGVIRLVLKKKKICSVSNRENKQYCLRCFRPLYVLLVLIDWNMLAELEMHICWIFFLTSLMNLFWEFAEMLDTKFKCRYHNIDFAANVALHLICLVFLMIV